MSTDHDRDEVFAGLATKLAAAGLTDGEREMLDLIVIRAASADDEVGGFMYKNPAVTSELRDDGVRSMFDKVMKPDGTSVPGLSLEGLKLGAGFSLG